jgi:hypothetical protein
MLRRRCGVAMDEEYVQEHICHFHSLVLKGVFQETKECIGGVVDRA